MVSKTDLRAYFKRKAAGYEGPVISATERINALMVIDEIEKPTSRKNHYNNIPKHIRIEVGRYALDHNTKGALEKISKQYSKFTFKDISISLWKTLLKKCEDN